MDKKKEKIVKIVLIVLTVLSFALLVQQAYLYNIERCKKIAEYNYDDKQLECEQIGTSSNYIFIYRLDKSGKGVEGSRWKVTDKNGKEVAQFEINSSGTGGVVGLNYGEYCVQEISAPKGHKVSTEKYLAIISKADTSYTYVVGDELEDEQET